MNWLAQVPKIGNQSSWQRIKACYIPVFYIKIHWLMIHMTVSAYINSGEGFSLCKMLEMFSNYLPVLGFCSYNPEWNCQAFSSLWGFSNPWLCYIKPFYTWALGTGIPSHRQGYCGPSTLNNLPQVVQLSGLGIQIHSIWLHAVLPESLTKM